MTNSLPTLSSVDTPPSMQAIAFQAIKMTIMCNEFLPGNIYGKIEP
jgi:hypothetical protein